MVAWSASFPLLFPRGEYHYLTPVCSLTALHSERWLLPFLLLLPFNSHRYYIAKTPTMMQSCTKGEWREKRMITSYRFSLCLMLQPNFHHASTSVWETTRQDKKKRKIFHCLFLSRRRRKTMWNLLWNFLHPVGRLSIIDRFYLAVSKGLFGYKGRNRIQKKKNKEDGQVEEVSAGFFFFNTKFTCCRFSNLKLISLGQ